MVHQYHHTDTDTGLNVYNNIDIDIKSRLMIHTDATQTFIPISIRISGILGTLSQIITVQDIIVQILLVQNIIVQNITVQNVKN